ncbi:MAG: hypothetical protein U9M89_02655 [Patescibacteria group bacterium]|nr:hypothetical protein [Patescibacteria group bacterium]
MDGKNNTFTVASAKAAAKKGKLRDWAIQFLEGIGGNQTTADKIKEFEKEGTLEWTGPILFDLNKLTPMVSSEEGEEFYKPNWEKDSNAMKEAILGGWEPPPLISTDWEGQSNVLPDGNHRWKALQKAGLQKYWTIFFRKK